MLCFLPIDQPITQDQVFAQIPGPMMSLADQHSRALEPGADAASSPSEKPNNPFEAFLWVTLSMLFLAAIAGLVRYITKLGFDPFQILFLRTVFSVLWMSPLLLVRGTSLVRTDQFRLYGTRVVISYISMLAMFHALDLITVGEVTAISFLSPIFGTLFAIIILGERVHAKRWLALAIGLVGAAIILRPGTAAFGLGQTFALISALAIGLIGPLVKKLTGRDDADRIVFITNLFMVPLSLIPALFVWKTPTPEIWLALAALGLVAVLGHVTLVRGYTRADASLVMTFKFSRLPFSVLIGYLAFGEMIDGPTWLGAAIIFAAAVYITHRETRLHKTPQNSVSLPPQD